MRKVGKAVFAMLREPARNRRAILRVAFLAPRVARSVRANGFAQTRTWLASHRTPDLESPVPEHVLRYADRAVRALPLRISCLERSLVLWWLSQDDLAIRLGVSSDSDENAYRFHAWIERNGIVINDRADVSQHFLPLSIDTAESADPMRFK